MKVLYVSFEAMWPSGIGTHVAATAHAMAERGHDVHVLKCVPSFRIARDDGRVVWANPRVGDELQGRVWVHGRRHVRIRGMGRVLPPPAVREGTVPTPNNSPWASPVKKVNAWLSDYLAYRRLHMDFDVIVVPEAWAEGLPFILLGTAPVVVDFHGPLALTAEFLGFRPSVALRVSDRLERLVARGATLTTVPSRFAARELVRAGWVAARDARVVPWAIDVQAWSEERPASETQPQILSVGVVNLVKGGDVLIRAAARLRSRVPGLQLTFVGPSTQLPDGGDTRSRLQALASDLRVPCRFVGPVARDELGRWYGAARVVALSSRYDTFGQVGLEALAAGRPFVCSDRTGVGEMAPLTDGAMNVVPAEDPDALAGALEPVLTDPALAAERGRRARAFVEREVRPDRYASRQEAVYHEAIQIWRARRGN